MHCELLTEALVGVDRSLYRRIVRAGQGQCGKDVSIGGSFIVQWLWEKVSETTSNEANFSSRFSRIILKNFPSKVFRRLKWAFHVASRLWKERQPSLDRHQRVFGFSQFLRICMHREIRQTCKVLLQTSAKYIEILAKTYCLICLEFLCFNRLYFTQEMSYVCQEMASIFFSFIDSKQIWNVLFLFQK